MADEDVDVPRGRMLVVEDDYFAAADLLPKLRALGIEVVGPVPNVAKGMQILRNAQEISGAVLDINLGEETVFPLADELERLKVPFLFTTGYGRQIVPDRFKDRAFIEKPVDFAAISSGLATMLSLVQNRKSSISGNAILSALPPDEAATLAPFLRTRILVPGELIEEQFGAIEFVHFIESGILSMVAVSADGSALEAGMIGREGLSGFQTAEGDAQTAFRLVVQIAGVAQRVRASDFVRILSNAPRLRALTAMYARSLFVQLGYTSLAGGQYKIEQRLARWLLMMHDRIATNSLPLTHRFISGVLGVQRPGITAAMHVLEGEHLIRSLRNEVIILSRSGLKEFARGSYGSPEEEYERLMGFAVSLKTSG